VCQTGWEALEGPCRYLQDVFEVGALGADAQVVEDGITLLVLELGGVALLLLSLLDGGEMRAVTGRLGRLTLN
jgi:hypothetical protein